MNLFKLTSASCLALFAGTSCTEPSEQSSNNESGMATDTSTVVLPNLTVVEAGSNITVEQNEVFTLNALATAMDDTQLSYSWDIDGTNFSGQSVSTSLAISGIFTATLTIDDGNKTLSDSLQITVEPVATISNESYTLLNTYPQYSLYRIDNCGVNSTVDSNEYLFVDGVLQKINNSWNHVDGSSQWQGIQGQPTDYEINTGYTNDAQCNNRGSINNTLVKKYGDWDSAHANGFKFPMPNDNPTFADLDTITMDIYIDSGNSELPTIAQIKSAYPSLTQAELAEFDDGEFYLDMRITFDGVDPDTSDDYATHGDIHGAINLSIDAAYADQWMRVEIPVRSLNFTEEVSGWALEDKLFSEIKDLAPSSFAFVAETKSRKVYRHYDANFDVNTAAKLFKEEAIRIKYLEISKNDGSLVDPEEPIENIDYSKNDDMLYTSGELYSLEEYLYGSIEVRMKVAKGSGVVNGYFTYKNGSEISGTPWEEIDMEVLGKNNAVDLQTNVITGTSAARITSEAHHTQVQSLADDFHVYRMDWYPDRVEFFLDGQMLSRDGKENMSVDQYASLTSPQGLRLNLWPANIAEWVGVIDDSVYPVKMEVDYMEYSSLNDAQNGFNIEWRDEFNSIDTAKWGFGDWTFGENDARFNPEQVTTVDGFLNITLAHYK